MGGEIRSCIICGKNVVAGTRYCGGDMGCQTPAPAKSRVHHVTMRIEVTKTVVADSEDDANEEAVKSMTASMNRPTLYGVEIDVIGSRVAK